MAFIRRSRVFSLAAPASGLILAARWRQAECSDIKEQIQRDKRDRRTHGRLKIFSGQAHPKLAAEIAGILDVDLGDVQCGQFKNGETEVILKESVRDCDVFLVQPTCNPCPNEYLMELLIMMDACRRGGAGRITAVIPLFGYARQDKKDKSRAPITAKLVADMLQLAGADRVITIDLHASQIQGFVAYPIDNLYATPLITSYIRREMVSKGDICIVSPDAGGAKRAEGLADTLGCDIAIFSKKRKVAGVVDKMILTGEVEGKVCILIDDMADTAGTLCKAAHELAEQGATSVHAAVIHGVLSDPALKRLAESPIQTLLVTDSIPDVEEKAQQCDKIKTLSVAPLLAAAIVGVHRGGSIACLFDDENPHPANQAAYVTPED